MAQPSPLQPVHDAADAMMIPYGEGVEIVGQYDAVEVEYAAIRKSVGLMDCPHRGLLRLTGNDRLDFLHRLVTHDCRSLRPGEVRRAFVLTGKGRIMADLLIVHAEQHTLIDTDIHQAPTVADELDKLLFGEDVRVEDLSASHHRVSLHGPRAAEVVEWFRTRNAELGTRNGGGGAEGSGARGQGSGPSSQFQVPSWEYHYDETGEPGIHIWAPAGSLGVFAESAAELAEQFRLRFIGWMAWNMARIEAGRAVFHVDFGPDSLPHEAGPEVMQEAVSFTKGCYRGQEIVARMQSLGHPAKRLVGFRVEGGSLPIAGVSVRSGDSPDAPIVGAVTSSTLSPMLSAAPIGFAMVKWAHHKVGTTLYAPAEGRDVPLTVREMRFYNPSKPI